MSDAIHGHFAPIGCPDCKEAADENERLTEELGKLRNDYDYAVTAWNKEIDRNALSAKEDTNE